MDNATENMMAAVTMLNCIGYSGKVEYAPDRRHLMMGSLIEKTRQKIERQENLMGSEEAGAVLAKLLGHNCGGLVGECDDLWGGLVRGILKTEAEGRIKLLDASKKTRLDRMEDYAACIGQLYERYPHRDDRMYIDCTDGLDTSVLKLMLILGAAEPDKLEMGLGKMRLYQMGKLCDLAERIYHNPPRKIREEAIVRR